MEDLERKWWFRKDYAVFGNGRNTGIAGRHNDFASERPCNIEKVTSSALGICDLVYFYREI